MNVRKKSGFSHDNWRLDAKKTDGEERRGEEDDHEMTMAVAVRENSDEIRRRSSSVKAAKVASIRVVSLPPLQELRFLPWHNDS